MRTVLTTFLLAFLLVSTTVAQPGPPDRARPVEGVILIKFAPEALESPPQRLRPGELQGRQVARLRRLLNARRGPGRKIFRNFMPADTLARHRQTGEQVRLVDLSRWYRFPVPDTTNVDSLASRLEELQPVLKATPDYFATPGGTETAGPSPLTTGRAATRTVPNDSLFDEQWGFDDVESGINEEADVNAPEAWSLNKGRSDVTVAVVDGGVDLDHPDLDPGDRSRIIQGADLAEDDGNPDDDLPPGGWANHGTPVAGTIGAITDNGLGVAGMMWNVQIMPIKVASGDHDPPSSTVAEGFDYARANGADIINYSAGSFARGGPRDEVRATRPPGTRTCLGWSSSPRPATTTWPPSPFRPAGR